MQERELPNGRGAVLQVKGLTEAKVASAEAALAMIQQGLDNRKVGAQETAGQNLSARCHNSVQEYHTYPKCVLARCSR